MAAEQSDTIVGANVELKGSLRNQGPIHIHGKIVGDVYSDSLIVIGETAIVTGPVVARQVDVSGQVHGSITAEEQLELQPKCLVKGDINTGRLSIKPGATFIGKCTMGNSSTNSASLPSEEIADEQSIDKKKPRLEIE